MIDAETENVSPENMYLVRNTVMKQYVQRYKGVLKLINSFCFSMIKLMIL